MFKFSQNTLDWVAELIGFRQKKSSIEKEIFSLFVMNLPEDTFQIISFRGQEGISQCYQFEFSLLTRNKNLDVDKALESEVLFLVNRGLEIEDRVPFYGILSELEQKHGFKDFIVYRAVMVPKLWWLTQTRHNQIFLDLTVPEMLSQVLEDGGLASNEYEFRLSGDAGQRWEYVCQYKESHYNFFSRWLEREGWYYFFEVTDEAEKVVVTDTRISHVERTQGKNLVYHPPSGLEHEHQDEIISHFNCRYRRVPKSVILQDYNYRRPSMKMMEQAEVLPRGVGEYYMYGDHFLTPEEGKRLAEVRAEEMRCRRQTFNGRSSVPYLRPGYIFQLRDHYQDEFNIEYLTTEIQHEGNQSAYLTKGLFKTRTEGEKKPFYRNSFSAIPASIQYRPPLISEKPRFHGTLNAKIDAAGSGKYAELDDQGRYKVVLPFDLSGRKDGKASAWLRMAQPYVGPNHGMHFPLHKNTEVLLTFIDGDPDRPIIAGAVPNPDTPSMVTSANATLAGFRTAGGTGLRIEDREGKERALLKSGGGAMLSLGHSSPSEFFSSALFTQNISPVLNSTWTGFWQSTLSMMGQQMVTGFPWIQVGFGALAAMVNAVPDGLASNEPPKNAVDSLAIPIGTASVIIGLNVGIALLKAHVIKKRIKARLGDFEYPKAGFSIYRSKDGAFLDMAWKGTDILFCSTDGGVASHAKESIWLTSSDGIVHIRSEKEEIKATAEKNFEITSKAGDVVISTENSGNIVLKPLGNGHVQIGSTDMTATSKTEIQGMTKLKLSCGTSNDKPVLTMKAAEATLDGSKKLSLVSSEQAKLTVDASMIDIQKDSIDIQTGGSVKIKQVTIEDDNFKFSGGTASFGDVLKVKDISGITGTAELARKAAEKARQAAKTMENTAEQAKKAAEEAAQKAKDAADTVQAMAKAAKDAAGDVVS